MGSTVRTFLLFTISILCIDALQVTMSSVSKVGGSIFAGNVLKNSQTSSRTATSSQDTRSKVTTGRRVFDVLANGPQLPMPQIPSITDKNSASPSGLIAQLAEYALTRRLQAQTSVKCDVNASPTDLLLKGKCGPVKVQGRGWQSRLGLTCRVIEATVDSCELDTAKLLSDQKLRLKNPAKGRSMMALNAEDFSNFINHPLMLPPLVDGAPENAIQFLNNDVNIDPLTNTVTFYLEFQNVKYKCVLRRGEENNNRAVVDVSYDEDRIESSEDIVSTKLSSAMSKFFNDMIFDLDGVSLSFRDMMITGKGGEPSLMLSLNILVRKLPSRNAEF